MYYQRIEESLDPNLSLRTNKSVFEMIYSSKISLKSDMIYSTGKYRVQDPWKQTCSKTHGRSILKNAVMGLGAGKGLRTSIFMGLGTDIFYWVLEPVIFKGLGTGKFYGSWNR